MATATTGDVSYQTIEVTPLIGSLGAEIEGVDIRQPLEKRQVEEIRRAWLEHLVIVLRDQDITPQQQCDFAEQFGVLDTYPFVKPLDGYPSVIPIIKEADNKFNFGGGWHTDTSYQETPPMATLLYAIDVPTNGGDTMFANMQMAYESLSSEMKSIVQNLHAVFSSQKVHGAEGYYKNADYSMEKQKDEKMLATKVSHPLCRTHPETGRKGLYISLPHILKCQGLGTEESDTLLRFLGAHAVKAEFVTRVRWKPGTLVMWDNRCVQHYALNDYPGQRREMHRITLKGDRPV